MRRHGQHIVSRHVVLQSVSSQMMGYIEAETAADDDKQNLFFSLFLHLFLMTIDADVTAISQL